MGIGHMNIMDNLCGLCRSASIVQKGRMTKWKNLVQSGPCLVRPSDWKVDIFPHDHRAIYDDKCYIYIYNYYGIYLKRSRSRIILFRRLYHMYITYVLFCS